MRRAVRAIVIHDDKLLVMHRNKFGAEYYTLVGGGIDYGETAEQSLHRELHEESGIQIKNPRLVYIEEAGDPFGTQYIYLCDYISGEPKLMPESEEAAINKLGQNTYTPLWLPLRDLPAAPFVSKSLKATLIEALKSGFPKNTVNIP